MQSLTFLAQKALFLPPLHPYKNRFTKGAPYSLRKVSSFQARYLLSNLNGWCRSYLLSTKDCWTRFFLLHSSYCLSVKMNVFLTIWLRNKSLGNQTCCRYPRCKLRYPWWRRSDPNPRTSSCWTDCAASKRSALPHRNSSSCIRMLLWLTRRKGPKESLLA